MNSTTATGRVTTIKGHPFQRNRYGLYLYIEDVYTGLHWHVNRKQAKTMPSEILDHATELLEHYGIMEAVYAKVTSDRAGLPAVGSKIKLAADLGKVKAGLIGTVVMVDTLTGDIHPDHAYPVTAEFEIKGEAVKIALNVSEYEKVSA